MHIGAHTKKVMEVMPVPVSELGKVSRTQRQDKLPPEFVSTGSDRSNLEHGPRRGNVYGFAAKRGRRPRGEGI